jgi:RNA polymerase sigma-70 factor (ECF subfamily)
MDTDLVVRAQRGDLSAFEGLATASHPRLYRVALGILRDTDRAEDATQAALVDIWKYLRRLREPAAYESWSYRLLVRASIREARNAPRWLPDVDLGSRVDPRASYAFGAIADRDQLDRGFRRLSIDHRVVIVMRYLLDMPIESVARALDIPPGTVASRLNRAMAALRAALESDARPSTIRLERREADR